MARKGNPNGDTRNAPFFTTDRVLTFAVGAIVAGLTCYFTVIPRLSSLETKIESIQHALDDLKSMPATFARLDEKVNTIARDVDRLRSNQEGKLSSIYKRAKFIVLDAAATPRVYSWKFKQPIPPDSITGMTVQPADIPAGVSVVSTIAVDGTGCEMTFDGPADAIQQLPQEIPADVTITTRS